jgi:hypothetical protein
MADFFDGMNPPPDETLQLSWAAVEESLDGNS